MEIFASLISLILSVMLLVLSGSQAEQSPQGYWKSVLPNTRMPKAVQDLLLHPANEFTEEKMASAPMAGKVSNMGPKMGKPVGEINNVIVGQNGVGVKVKDKSGKRTTVGVGKGGILVNTIHKGKPIFVGVKPGPSPFVYFYSATAEQMQDNSNHAQFFLEKDLVQGTNMKLHFTKTSNESVPTFLPRKVADSIPFSSAKFPEILNRLMEIKSVSSSYDVDLMKQTINECEVPAIKGEEKYCATSLESMIDFATSKLGNHIQAFSTEVSKDQSSSHEFMITKVKKIADNSKKTVLCHKEKYAFAVFYCHMTKTTKAYMVSLAGADEARAKAFVVCHTDTSAWNPKHLAFQDLKIKPGTTVPVCHFLPEDHVVWVQK